MIPFHPFTAPHLVAVLCVVAAVAALVVAARRGPPERAARMGKALGVVLLGYYAAESLIRLAVQGHAFWVVLPFELCSALFFLGAWAFLTDHPLGFEVLYFWTFAGTLHALITPTPANGFPSLDYYRYFAAHGLLIASAAFAIFGLRRIPGPGGMRRAFLALQAFMLTVAAIDWLTGQNYFYLRAKPPSPTALDPLGPWPWYLLGGEAVALVSFAIWCAPILIWRRRSARAPA